MATVEQASRQKRPHPAELSWGYLVAKRSIDLTLSTLGLLIAVPIAVAVIVALKIDSPGPIFFRQTRVGQYGRHFEILKFRTMHWLSTPEMHVEHVHRLAQSPLSKETPLRLSDDPRVSRIGKFLRKWSVDELPNLWNVLKGEMSLVGPRPLVPYELETLDAINLRRLEVKPGVTGLAQVKGRLEMSIQRRADYDLSYVTRCRLTDDLRIILITPVILLKRRGA